MRRILRVLDDKIAKLSVETVLICILGYHDAMNNVIIGVLIFVF